MLLHNVLLNIVTLAFSYNNFVFLMLWCWRITKTFFMISTYIIPIMWRRTKQIVLAYAKFITDYSPVEIGSIPILFVRMLICFRRTVRLTRKKSTKINLGVHRFFCLFFTVQNCWRSMFLMVLSLCTRHLNLIDSF